MDDCRAAAAAANKPHLEKADLVTYILRRAAPAAAGSRLPARAPRESFQSLRRKAKKLGLRNSFMGATAPKITELLVPIHSNPALRI